MITYLLILACALMVLLIPEMVGTIITACVLTATVLVAASIYDPLLRFCYGIAVHSLVCCARNTGASKNSININIILQRVRATQVFV